MSGVPSSERLKLLPPYLIGKVDDLKRRLTAEGREIFDFGLGNPDGEPPEAVKERVRVEMGQAGFNRYMPSRGLPEVRQAICEWYQERYQQTFDKDTEAVATIGSKEGIGHLLFALVGAGDCVLTPDPAYPIHRFGVMLAGGEPVSVRVGPGIDHFGEIEKALAASPRKPRGLIVNFPHNPTTAVEDLSFFEKVVALAKKEDLWVISDLAYADLVYDGSQAPSIFQVPGARDVAVEFFTVSKSFNMPGWRVGFAVGNPTLVGALTSIKGYMDYGTFGPTQLAAATAVKDCRAFAESVRDLYRHRSGVLADALNQAGWPVERPRASMFIWAPLPPTHREMGSLEFAGQLLEKAGVAVAPGVGFGPAGEGHVRFSLVESDERVGKAGEAIRQFLA